MTSKDTIYTNVMETLKIEPKLDATNITISIQGNNDIVLLGGKVSSFAEKFAAEQAVKKLANVRGIANDIEVDLSAKYVKSDVEIAKDVLHALKSSISIPDENIKSVVKNGIVTLSGEVNWQFQKNNAFNAVHDLFGVKGVINSINIKPSTKIDAAEVKKQIINEFERHARIDANNIRVMVTGSSVTLEGKVRNFDEFDEAEDVVWLMAGVEDVKNKLEVDYNI